MTKLIHSFVRDIRNGEYTPTVSVSAGVAPGGTKRLGPDAEERVGTLLAGAYQRRVKSLRSARP